MQKVRDAGNAMAPLVDSMRTAFKAAELGHEVSAFDERLLKALQVPSGLVARAPSLKPP